MNVNRASDGEAGGIFMRPAEPFLTERLNFYEEFRGRAGKIISKARALQALFTPPSDIIQPVKDKREATLSNPSTNPLSPSRSHIFPREAAPLLLLDPLLKAATVNGAYEKILLSGREDRIGRCGKLPSATRPLF